ncbi:nucleolar protein dao-5-like [Maniola jurtina]|uniref:nucleolar protein dao-5-like n=1 Tax=Maniola jurtina TaxID=191418 RepID=UPI001E686095|nr:nucleolar protein dao-5-like [Maniola jurtina]XP_045777794.1 nucleolar protein dao-5-like [Maniola jurtina]XP_045777804.1 nucleolar protein dao-5-like [Maniola jurtina]
MGQAGSSPSAEQRARRANTLPHEPLRHAPKVLPSLTESPRLRSTDNGAILHSGGTISGRRPGSLLQESSRVPHGHVHSNVYRSRSAGVPADNEVRSRERDAMHRSHTNLDFRHDSNGLKRFGSEPDLRIEEEQQKPTRCTNNKNFRKKYRAPPPPSNNHREGSPPDSIERNAKIEPQRKLRLFRTRNETKKLNGHVDSKIPVYKNTYTDFKSLDFNDNFERRYKSPIKDKEQNLKHSDGKDMVQSTASLKKEERLLQARQDYKVTRTDRVSGCRAKTTKTNEHSEAWKTPLLSRNFRHSERFNKDDNSQKLLRREKTFDETLIISERENDSPRALHEKRTKAVGEESKNNKFSPLGQRNEPLRKSLPSLLNKSNEEKDEFQEELKKATSRIRKELGNKLNVSENKTSQNDKTSTQKPNPTKLATESKVKESSLKTNSKQDSKPTTNITRRPLSRINESKQKTQSKLTTSDGSKYKMESKENVRTMPDRGQASGKESTPEHSPTRKKETSKRATQEKQRPAPSKQFYFGMIETKKTETQDHLKDFPGLGSPIIEELSNFHLIEQKLLGYHDEDEMEKFNEKLKEDCKRNLSSESALSSEGSEGEGSEGSLGIALRLRPTLPKKLPNTPRFSPAAAWRQLASLDAHLAETQPLAVETKVSADISPESSPRSDQSADKSGDSGISADHGHSDHRIDSPREVTDQTATWTPQQDLGDSSSDGAGAEHHHSTVATYSPGAQPFSLSLPRDQDKGKPLQQGFNSLQKLRKSVSGALGAALGSRRFDLEHEPMLEEPEQNWFLTKSAPNSLSNPLLYHQQLRTKVSDDAGKEEPSVSSDKGQEEGKRWCSSYVNWGGHVMYLPPAPDQPLSMMSTDRPIRSKSSGCLEVAARAARAAALAGEMRERERSASPDVARAVPARVEPSTARNSNAGRGKRFTFQSTVRQLERRKIAEKLSREADLKEQQRRTELEAMRRVEEEFQRKRAREKANIRQQLRLVSSGANSMPPVNHHNKTRDEPDGSCRESPTAERTRETRQRHSNTSSEASGRSKSTTPIRCVELSEWRTENGTRVYRDWAVQAALAHAHPPACARMPMSVHNNYNAMEGSAFSGSPRSDNYRLEFARGRSPRTPRTPRAPRLLPAARSTASSTSGSELSLRQPIKIRW